MWEQEIAQKHLTEVDKLTNGKIIQVMGPVVDVKFDDGDLPYISDALYVYVEDKKRVMEVVEP